MFSFTFCARRDRMKRFGSQMCTQHREVDRFGQFFDLGYCFITLKIFRRH